ncbi:MAG: type II secretion system protein GspE, partial [Nitrospirota bacterium]
ELMEITPEIRAMIVERKDARSIRAAAISREFKTLRADGIEKIITGVTTMEEVLRVSQKDSET